MITRLCIENYALIGHLEVDFSKGLSIITGETGAGKSILIGALSLVLGERADSSVIKDKTKKCIAEVVFNVDSYNLAGFFQKNDLDWDKYTIVRRELTPAGRSRAFINDTPVQLSIVKELGEMLVDIHSQHQKLLLNKSSFQLSIVDAFAGIKDTLFSYKDVFVKKKAIDAELVQLLEMEKSGATDLDYWQFQVDELEKSGLDNVDLEGMEKESNMLEHAEDTKAALSEVIALLDRSETGFFQQLSECRAILAKLENRHTDFPSLNERMISLDIELKDICRELESINDSVKYDPERMQLIHDKLDNFSRLLHKHQAHSINDLKDLKSSLEDKIKSVSSLDEQILKVRKTQSKLQQDVINLSSKISAKRHSVVGSIEKEIKLFLVKMGLPNSEFAIAITPKSTFDQTGADEVVFLFKANKGSQLCHLNKTASGGELSRLMLALKASVAKFISLPTVVFDEIDSGISGEIADKVGAIMDKMAIEMQVITITHLPQIAAKGAHHYLAYKDFDGDKTFSSLKKLNNKSRVNEIAKMLSGETLSNAAIDNARELLQAH